MPFASLMPLPACSTSSSINVMSPLRWLAAPLLPGSIANAGLSVGGTRASAANAEMQAILESMGREAVNWGTSLCVSRLMRAADQLVPGVLLPYTAYRLFSSLSAVARGELSRALQTLPVAAVLPTDVLRALANCLDGSLPRWRNTAGNLDAVVIGVAVLALLHGLQEEAAPRRPATAVGRGLVRLFGHLRTAMTVMGSLRDVGNAHPAPRRHTHPTEVRALPATNASQLTPRPWSAAFPVADLAMRGRGGNATDSGGSWPLPSAEARGSGAGGPAPKPPVKGGTVGKGGKVVSSRHTSRVKVYRRMPGRHADMPGVAGSRHENRLHLPDTSDAVYPKMQGQKESVAVARSFERAAAGETATRKPRPSSIVQGMPAPDPRPRFQHAAAAAEADDIPADDSTDCGVHDADICPELPRTNAPGSTFGTATARLFPACVRFHAPTVAMNQVRKNRFDARDVSFCVSSNGVELLEGGFAAPPPDHADRIHWMHAVAVREQLKDMNELEILKYSGLAPWLREAPRRPRSLGTDEVYAVLSMSVLDGSERQNHVINASQQMENNSLRLLELIELSGNKRLFIAYFLNRGQHACRGGKAGFMEIHSDEVEGFTVTDEQSGYVLSSGSLPALMGGIEKLSGCRMLTTTEPSQHEGFHRATGAPVSRARKFFIDEAAAWCDVDVPDRNEQSMNENMRLFPVKTVHIGNQGVTVHLFPNSFALLAKYLIYHDANGRRGTLRILPSAEGQDLYHLDARSGTAADFAQAVGVQAGASYTLLELVEQLESHDLTWIPVHDANGRLLQPHRGGAGRSVTAAADS